MATGNLKLQEAIQRCQRGTAADVDKVFSDLRDATFLAALDGSQPYRLRQTPPGLSELLQNVAAITTAPDIPERLIALGNTREYAAADPDGSLRRTALIEAMGCVARPSDTIVSYLDAELDVAEGRYRSTAVSSLARLGTPKAFEVLRVRIYQRNTSIISEQTRAVYLRNYTVELAQYRDRPGVMAFLVKDLFEADELKKTVLECIAKDMVALGADPCFQFQMAPLTQETPEAVELARILAEWCISQGRVLAFLKAMPNAAGRIAALLGQPETTPTTGEADEVRAWAASVFSAARDAATDPKRRHAIAVAMASLP